MKRHRFADGVGKKHKQGWLKIKWLKVESERRKVLAEAAGLLLFTACGPWTCPVGPGHQLSHEHPDSSVTCSGNTGKTDQLVAATKTSNVNNVYSTKYKSSVLSYRAGTRGERSRPSGPVGVPAVAQGDSTLPLTRPRERETLIS